MSKIRINELARELEVKTSVILDMLPDLGVGEKKTHSSSVDEDVAVVLRQKLLHADLPESARERYQPEPQGDDRQDERASESLPADARAHSERSADSEVRTSDLPIQFAARPIAPPLRPPVGGLRPPLGGQPTTPAPAQAPLVPAPTIPVTTVPTTIPATPEAARAVEPAQTPPEPVIAAPATASAPMAPRPPEALRPPVESRPAAPARPAPPAAPARPPAPAAPSAPARPVAPDRPVAPARPMAPDRQAPNRQAAPSQPPGAPARPPSPQGPGAPRSAAPGQVLRPGTPLGGQSQAGVRPGAPIAPRPQGPRPGGPPPGPPQGRPPQGNAPREGGPRPARPLAGQPAARPVVPPRADILERLRQTQGGPPAARAGAPAPGPARPGAPSPGGPSPVQPSPGQPIFRGPRPGGSMPGQPRPGGPGQPRDFGPGRPGPGGPRPMGPRPGGPGGRPGAPILEPPPPAGATPAPDGRRPEKSKRQLDMEAMRERAEGRLKGGPRRMDMTPLPVVDKEITISEGITVKELSEKLGLKGNIIVKRLFEAKKVLATINQTIDVKMAEELATDFGARVRQTTYEEESQEEAVQLEDPGDLKLRAPVVTIMGHVDHGKTSLLDAIRSANVAAKEAGGITQHIGAYYVEKNDRKIVFIDTPGHEAFTRMRARGAKVTDIVILVVAADDGVMPQTLEAINHAKAAGVPLIVAINKIDKPEANIERIKQQLTDRGLMPEDWGGDTIMVPVSAKQQQNLDLLLEMILLVADLQELKANWDRDAIGTVLEAELDKGRGAVATVLVRNGTLKVGDYFICGSVFGRVRAMFDDRGNQLREAEPSMPVSVLGFENVPDVGDTFQVVQDTAKAKQIVLYREIKARDVQMAKTRVSLETLSKQMSEGETKELLVVVKADVGGTAEVLSDTLQKLSNEQVKIRVLATGVGAITESDVLLASASDAIIIGFSVRPERNAASLAEQEKVDIRLHTIIYELVDEVKKAMTGLLEPVFKEVLQGHAEIRQVFRITKVGNVAGCYVTDGFIKRSSEVRVLRDNIVIYTGKIDQLKRFKDDVSEVKQGFECGISVVNFNDIKEGDVFEAFMMEKVAAQLI